jgi:Xaa-Pro aminopeptidase
MRISTLIRILACVAAIPSLSPAQDGIATAEYGARRDSLAAAIDSGVVVAFGAREPVRHWPGFAQLPSFHYLTGFDEPDAAIVIVKRSGMSVATLFTTPVDAMSEIFNGARATREQIRNATGLASRSTAELRPFLDSLAVTLPLYVVSDIWSRDFARADTMTYGRSFVTDLARAHAGMTVKTADPLVFRLRAKKSGPELALIRRAADISVAGHKAALCAVRPDAKEYQVQAIMEYVFRDMGADGPGYASIVGSGSNGTILHYDRDTRTMRAGETVVMDVAAQYQGYSADVTRTLPVSGKFSPEARAIYQVVRDAQAAAERQVKPGAPGRSMTDSSNATLAEGLARLGLIESPTATYDPPTGARCASNPASCTQRSLFMPHGLGHGIGLDVHDPAQYSLAPDATMKPGDAFTIEPGIYVRANILDNLPDTPKNRSMVARLKPVVERYKNIGVRIEDDYIVTPSGSEWITRAPREVAELEAAMARGGCSRPVVP